GLSDCCHTGSSGQSVMHPRPASASLRAVWTWRYDVHLMENCPMYKERNNSASLVGIVRLLRVLAATRVYKVVPFVLSVAIAALSCGTVQPLAFISASACVFLVVVIGMHLNAITDRVVDRVRKPHLAEWTMSRPWTLRVILIIEFFACLIFLLIAGTVAPSVRI